MSNILTSKFRLSFPHLFTAVAPKGGGEAKFSLSMLFPKRDTLTGAALADYDRFIAAAREAAKAAAIEKFGAQLPKNLKSPFLDAGNHEYEGYEAGMVLLRASSKQKPGVVDAKLQAIIDESDVYPGCYARATIRAFAYDANGNRGVSFGLQNVQKMADGDPLGGRTRAEDDFSSAVAGEDGAPASDKPADSLFG
jgi:hypothetical protein